MGWQKEEGEWVRCASEKVECYAIKIDQLFTYFPQLCHPMPGLARRKRIHQNLTGVNTPKPFHESHTEEKQAILTPSLEMNK